MHLSVPSLHASAARFSCRGNTSTQSINSECQADKCSGGDITRPCVLSLAF